MAELYPVLSIIATSFVNRCRESFCKYSRMFGSEVVDSRKSVFLQLLSKTAITVKTISGINIIFFMIAQLFTYRTGFVPGFYLFAAHTQIWESNGCCDLSFLPALNARC